MSNWTKTLALALGALVLFASPALAVRRNIVEITNELRLPDGSASAPAMNFQNDRDSGLYRISTDNVGLTIGGTKIVDYSSTGIVVTGTVTATGGIVGGVETGSFADGTAGSPGIKFTNDPNSGFYAIGGDNIGLSLNGVKRWDFGATTSALTGNLTVSGTAAVTGEGTFTGNLGCDGGFDCDAGLFDIADTTVAMTWTPTTTTGDAATWTMTTVTSGTALKIIGDNDSLDGGYYLEFLGGDGADTAVLTVGEYGCLMAGTDKINNASGATMLYGYYIAETTAVTSNGIGVRGNARVDVNSASGNVIGGYFQAGNGSSTTGYNVNVMRGVYAEVVKKNAGAIDAARGIEVSMDWDNTTATTTTLTGARVEIQTGSSASAPVNSAGIHVTNQSVQGTGQQIDAAILVTQLSCGSSAGFDYGLDFGDSSFADDGLTFTNNVFGTADVRLSRGALIANTSADILSITEAEINLIGKVVADNNASATTDAGGGTMVTGYFLGGSNALTGDGVGVYGNARAGVDSTSGKVIGGYFKAGNGVTVAYDIDKIRGVFIEAVCKGTAESATIDAARGLEVSMDWDAPSTVTTTLTGARIEIQTGAAAEDITNSAGLHITNQSVEGTGDTIDAAILVTQLSCGSSAGFAYGLDFGDSSFPDDGLTFTNNIFSSADMRLSRGAIINNTTADVLSISEAEINLVGKVVADNNGSADTTAGGGTMVTGYFLNGTNALTGDGIGVYGNARPGVDSIAGNVIGGYFKAGNGASSTGYDIDKIRGVFIEAVCKGTASATVDSARGLEVSMDWDGEDTVTTTLTGARIEIQTGASAEDITNSAGLHITNQSVQSTGDTIGAALLVTQLSCGSSAGFTYGLDFGNASFADDGLTFTNNVFATADMRLSRGALIANTSADILSITEAEVNIIGYLTSDNNGSAINSTSGRTMITGYYLGGTTALTSDGIGVYGNSRIEVDSTSGNLIGGYFKAGNGPSSTGFSIDKLRGVFVEVVKKTGSTKAIDAARGLEVSMDWDAATTTTTTLTGARIEIQSGASASAPTHSAGLHITNQSVSGAGQKMEAAILVTQLSCGDSGGFDYGLDFGNSDGFADDGLTFLPNVFGTADIRLSGGPTISASTTAPNGSITAPKGSIHIDTDASADAQLFINTDGSTTWEAIASG